VTEQKQNIGKDQETNTVKSQKIEKRKKVSFDDILTNMNLVVRKDGTLQSMTPKTNIYD
jgi:hypothetical protein